MASHPPSHRGVTLGTAVRVTAGEAAGMRGFVGEAKFYDGRLVEWRLKSHWAEDLPGANAETWVPVDAVVRARVAAEPGSAAPRPPAAAAFAALLPIDA